MKYIISESQYKRLMSEDKYALAALSDTPDLLNKIIDNFDTVFRGDAWHGPSVMEFLNSMPMNVVDAMEFLLGKLEATKSNQQFLGAMGGN